MSEFLVPHDPSPQPRRSRAGVALSSSARPFPAATVHVVSVPGGVRLTFAAADRHAPADELVAALAGVVARERRDSGVLRFALEVQPDGVAVHLTITSPPVLRGRGAAPRGSPARVPHPRRT